MNRLAVTGLIAVCLVLAGCSPDPAPVGAEALAPGTYQVRIESEADYSARAEAGVFAGQRDDYRVEMEVPAADGSVVAAITMWIPADASAGFHQICYRIQYELDQCAPQTVGLAYEQIVGGTLVEQDEFARAEVTLEEGDGLTGEFSFYANFFDAGVGADVTGSFNALPLPGASE